MRLAPSYLLVTFCVAQTLYGEPNNLETNTTPLIENPAPQIQETPPPPPAKPPKPPISSKPFAAFTGRTLKNKVRIRLQPSLDAPILREINKGDLFIVVGETDDFYALQAPSDVKGYVFRTYILDNVVEGNRVNVRLEPNLEAPIITQLNAGDKIEGQISALNSKWLEIAPPSSTRFFIAKEYVEKLGNAELKAKLDQKRASATALLNSTFTASQSELSKPWNEIHLDSITENLNKIIKDTNDFPDIQSKAKELLTMVQESYFQKKIVYLEALSKNTDLINAHNKELSSKLALQEQQINQLEQKNRDLPGMTNSNTIVTSDNNQAQNSNSIDKMETWLPIENHLYESWAESHENQPIAAFYDNQLENATVLKGVIQAYDRAVRNKPGDFVLLNPITQIPDAYLYSTKVNLQDYIGKQVTVKAYTRDNNNFAYPAYFVLSIE